MSGIVGEVDDEYLLDPSMLTWNGVSVRPYTTIMRAHQSSCAQVAYAVDETMSPLSGSESSTHSPWSPMERYPRSFAGSRTFILSLLMVRLLLLVTRVVGFI